MKIEKFVKVFVVVVIMALVLVVPVLAMGAGQDPEPPTGVGLGPVLQLLLQYGQLAGVGMLFAAVVNVAKVAGLPDGRAGQLFAALNLFGFGVMVYLHYFQPGIAVEFVDAQAAIAATITLGILGYIVQLRAGQIAHKALAEAKVPVLGASHSEGTATLEEVKEVILDPK